MSEKTEQRKLGCFCSNCSQCIKYILFRYTEDRKVLAGRSQWARGKQVTVGSLRLDSMSETRIVIKLICSPFVICTAGFCSMRIKDFFFFPEERCKYVFTETFCRCSNNACRRKLIELFLPLGVFSCSGDECVGFRGGRRPGSL